MLDKDTTQKRILPPIVNRMKTQTGTRKNRKLNEIKSNSSFEVGLFSDKALKLLEKGKMSVKNKNKPIWKPSGTIGAKDGYATKPKIYY